MLIEGDVVTWTSQSQGHEKVKYGIVVAVVPPGWEAFHCLPAGFSCNSSSGYGRARDHTSYLVQVGSSKRLYWPVTSKLNAIRGMQHVMIDLETLGRDYDAVFTTIGACEFDPYTGDIGRTFYQSVNWNSALEAGRTVDGETIKWWMLQPEETRSEIVKDGISLQDALMEFKDWLPEDPIVWGNGPTFDISKLETAYGFYDIPWNFRNIRCVRTIRGLAEGLVCSKDVPDDDLTHHKALSDAIWQARYVSMVYKALGK